MGVFSQPEWANFVRVVRIQPWHCFGYVLGLSRLVFRRYSNTLYIKLMGKEHRGLKRWPEWLANDTYEVNQKRGELIFPQYSLPPQIHLASEVPELRFDATDAEGCFAFNRWGNCLVAALEGEDEARRALEDALSWIRSAPEKHNAAWETYSSCERVANLAVMLAAHPNLWLNFDAGKKKEIAGFFVESSRWITSHLEYYGIEKTNNHILNNARALVVAGGVLGDELLIERGLVIFSYMAKELFQPGGFLRERSSHYQYVVTNWLLDTLHFSRTVPMARTDAYIAIRELEELSVRVSSATASLIAALDGLNTHIGDISPDNHPVTAILRIRTLYPYFFLENKGNPDKRLDNWLFISSGKHQLLTCGMPDEYPFDYATHGHHDLGSFVWGYNRRPLLVDAGRSSYVVNDTSRMQCGHLGHNVMTVNGLSPLSESLLMNGCWCPKPYAVAKVSLEYKSANGFVLEHDGFSRILGVKGQTRTVRIIRDGIEILDTLEGLGMVEIDLYWHFAPGVSLLQKCPSTLVGADFQILVVEGDADTADVHWEEYPYAEAYGNVQKAYMLHTKRSVSLPWSGITTMKVIQCAE